MLSHLETSPESKATGACNTIVKVPTVYGFRLVAQNTESEVCFYNANCFFFFKTTSANTPKSPLLLSSKSLRRSECINRRLTSSIPNSQYPLQRCIIPPSFKKTRKSSRSRHRWRRKSPFCHLCSFFSARSSSYLSPQSGWWRNRMFDEFFSELEEKKGSGISQKSNRCCEMFRENYISCCFNGCGCHSYVWIPFFPIIITLYQNV